MPKAKKKAEKLEPTAENVIKLINVCVAKDDESDWIISRDIYNVNRRWQCAEELQIADLTRCMPLSEMKLLQKFFEELPANHVWFRNIDEHEYSDTIAYILPVCHLRHYKTAAKDPDVLEYIVDNYIDEDAVIASIQNPCHPLDWDYFEGSSILQLFYAEEVWYEDKPKRTVTLCPWWTKELLLETLPRMAGIIETMGEYDIRYWCNRLLCFNDHIKSITEHHKLLPLSPNNMTQQQRMELLDAVLENTEAIKATMGENPGNVYDLRKTLESHRWTIENMNKFSILYPDVVYDSYNIRQLYERSSSYIKRLTEMKSWENYWGSPQPNPNKMSKHKTTGDCTLSAVLSLEWPNVQNNIDEKYIREIVIPGDLYEQFHNKLVETVKARGVKLNGNNKVAWDYTERVTTTAINSIPEIKKLFDDHMALVAEDEKKAVATKLLDKVKSYTSSKVLKELGPAKNAPINLINSLAEDAITDALLKPIERFCKKFNLELNDIPALVEDMVEKVAGQEVA